MSEKHAPCSISPAVVLFYVEKVKISRVTVPHCFYCDPRAPPDVTETHRSVVSVINDLWLHEWVVTL